MADQETVIEAPKESYLEKFNKADGGDGTPPVEKVEKKEEKPAKVEKTKEPEKSEKKASLLETVLPKKEEKKEEGDGDWEKEEVLTKFDPKEANWKEARKVMGTQSMTVRNLNKEIEKLKAAPKTEANTADLEVLRTELAGAKEKLASQEKDIKAINGRYSDEYRSLEKDMQTVIGKAVNRAKSYGADGESMAEALSLPEGRLKSGKIKEILSELDPNDRARVLTLVENAADAQDKIADFEKDLPSKWEEIQQRRDAQAIEKKEAHVKTLQGHFGKIIQDLPSDFPTLREAPKDTEGSGDWNQDIQTAKDEAWKVVNPNGGSDARTTLQTAILGQHYPFLMKRFIAQHEEMQEQAGRLAKYEGAEPEFKGVKGKGGEKKMTPYEKYQAADGGESKGDQE